ncbi:MAG: copper ion binding protein, partial [Pseudobdellovibrionaceae bacterium]
MLAQLNTQNETSMGLQIPIKGMTCASCVARVEKAVGKLSEVQSVSVNLATESARIEMKAKKADRLPDVIQAIEKAGYEVPFEELDFRVTGMTCSSCISHVEEFLAEIPGLLESSVNLGTEKAHVKVIKGMVTKEQLKKAIEDAGYEAHFEEGNISSINEEKEKEIQKDKIKLLISTALTLPLVLPMLAEPFGLNWMLPAWIQLLLATPVQFV